jgi:nucleoside-diphosphate-sugar epimerase
MRKAIVFGGGGFIGSHLVKRLKLESYYVISVDMKFPEFDATYADEYIIGDLSDQQFVNNLDLSEIDEAYQLAADMGGAGYIFSELNDAHIMYKSTSINLNVLHACHSSMVKKIFFSSSACIYPFFNQNDVNNPICNEASAYPASPDSEYGWEKLYAERLYLSFKKNYGLDVKIGRFHNVYGPMGAYDGGREKVPAAICRKVANAKNGDTIDVWGDGLQTRSFLYIDDCLDAIQLLLNSEHAGPFNIGSEEMISINDFTKMIIEISGKQLAINNIPGPLGVRGRNSDNTLIKLNLNWEPKYNLNQGMQILYQWISSISK